jgi:hypothetical protein
MAPRKQIAIAIMVAAMAVIPALASASTLVTIDITGGHLDFDIAGDAALADVHLTGSGQTTRGALGTIAVRDMRGTGAGWNLVVEASDFVSDDGSGNTIPVAGFAVDSTPTVTTLAGNAAPQTFSGPLDRPLKLLSAPADAGMGHYQISPDISLFVPADTFAGAYESTVTATIMSGP